VKHLPCPRCGRWMCVGQNLDGTPYYFDRDIKAFQVVLLADGTERVMLTVAMVPHAIVCSGSRVPARTKRPIRRKKNELC
jgi:hypothetical protein